MPVWRGLQLVNDPFTMAKAGRRILTAVAMVGFDTLDLGGYAELSFKTG